MESTTITYAQRQAIIDNFQLEIAERARKLRSQYNLQAQGLRARLEMRVNRIPQALRKRNIAELMEEHENKSRPAPPPPMPVASERAQPPQAALPPVIRSRQAQTQAAKRKSDEISTLSSEGADKENEELPNPKKRSKPTTTAATANSKASRTLPATRKAAVPGTTNPAGVLSPRSNNSRTLPNPPAPFKSSNFSPEKKTIPRSGATSRAGAISRTGNTSRAGARTTTKAPPASSDNGRSSEASAGSNGTTVIKAKKAAPKKTTTTGTLGSKTAAAKKAAANTTAAVGRTLRKRN